LPLSSHSHRTTVQTKYLRRRLSGSNRKELLHQEYKYQSFQNKCSTYSRRSIYNQREKYNQWPFRGLFSYVNNFFDFFLFAS
jgi:hypothetical protein